MMKSLKTTIPEQILIPVKCLILMFAFILIYNQVPAQQPKEKETLGQEQQINTDSILKIANEAIKNIDFKKINMEIQSALKVLDTLNINAIVKDALAKVDFAKATSSLDSAIKKMQSAEIRHQLELSRQQLMELQKNKNLIKKVDMEKIKKELKQTQKELEKMRRDLKKDIKAGDADNAAFQMNFRDYNNSLPFITL